jgi:hypothetical protein
MRAPASSAGAAPGHRRQRIGQGVQGAAPVVQIEQTVTAVGVGGGGLGA